MLLDIADLLHLFPLLQSLLLPSQLLVIVILESLGLGFCVYLWFERDLVYLVLLSHLLIGSLFKQLFLFALLELEAPVLNWLDV